MIITRKIISPDILLNKFNKNGLEHVYNYTEFCQLIDRWKVLLIDKYNAQPGQTCLIDYTFISPTYFAAIFAATELGLVLIVDLPHCYNDQDVLSYKVNMHGKIDYVITHEVKYNPEHVFYYEFDVKRNAHIGKNVVVQRELNEHVVSDPTLNDRVADIIWCRPEDPIVYACSSGTTGVPKRIKDNHKKVYLMAKRLEKHLGFEATDRVLHTRNIHHGASMVYHFLPAFMCGGQQFTPGFTVDDLSEPGITNIINFVRDNQIDHLFLYRPEFLHNFLNHCEPMPFKFKVQTLYQYGEDVLKLAHEKNARWISVTFGDTHIGLGLFTKIVPTDTLPERFEATNMGPPNDDFYNFDIRNGRLYISIPSTGQDWKTSNDKFEVVGGEYVFEGRADQYRIGEEWIDFDAMDQTVKQIFKGSASFSIDFEMQKLYLALWRDNPEGEVEFNKYLNDTYEALRIAYVLRGHNVKEFFNGRKIDLSRVRDYCRAGLGITLEDTFLKGTHQ
jgi:hypothetical protein